METGSSEPSAEAGLSNDDQVDKIGADVRKRCRTLIRAIRELLVHQGGDPKAVRGILGEFQRLRRVHRQREHSRLSDKDYARFSAEGARQSRRQHKRGRLSEDELLHHAQMVRLEKQEPGKVAKASALELDSKAELKDFTRWELRHARQRALASVDSPEQHLLKGRPPNPHEWLMRAVLTVVQAKVPTPLGYSTVPIEGDVIQRTGPTMRLLRAAAEFFRVRMSDAVLVECIRTFRSHG